MFEKEAEEYANNEVPFDITESGEKLYTKHDVAQAYIAGISERCMCCDKVGKWRNLNGIHEKLAQSYKAENEQLQSRLDKAIEYIKNIEEDGKKLVHSNNLAERLVNMIPKFEYMSKEDKKLVVLEAEQYIKGVR